MSGHTLTPWFVVGPPWGDGTWIVAGNPDPHKARFVCDFAADLEEWEEGERDVLADAEFVVQAVNVHEELVEAAALVLYTFWEDGHPQAECSEALRQLLAAKNKAEGHQ